jgi:peptidoglycan hydrolase-like protein with peptidoglycan-binding domain
MKKLKSIITILTLLMPHAVHAKVDKDVNVAKVQAMLAELCYEPGIVDGAWGKKTETAVKSFFAKHYRKYDGSFDVNDANFILSAGASAKAFGSASVKKCLVVYSDRIGDDLKNAKIKQITQKVANKNTELCKFISCKSTFNRWHKDARKEIYEIQSSLNYAGFDAGEPNGLIGNKTLIAVKNYYTEKNKKFDGVLSENEFNEIVRYSSNPSFKIFNDFSRVIYKSGISIQPSGNYPSAVKISNGTAKFTLTPKMYSNYSKKHQRFEIGKKQIPEHLALRIKFKFKSDNKVSDRVLIAQIKSHQKMFGTVGPFAAVYIDRPPKCATWNRNKYYPEKLDYYVDNPIQHSTKGLLVYSIKRKNGLYEYVWADRKKHEINRSYTPLNDGKWHDIEMHAYPHNKKGFCRIYIDGKLMLEINNAPTKSYVANYGDYAARIGIYRDAVNYNQTVEFDDFEIIGYKP